MWGRRAMVTFSGIPRYFRVCPRFVRLFYYGSINLKHESRLLSSTYNVNRYSTLADLKVPETDINKFLKHLLDAHVSGESTQFKEIVNNKFVKELMNEKIGILENIESLAKLTEEDDDLRRIAEEEQLVNRNQLLAIDSNIIDEVLEYLGEDNHNDVILEISAGVGGQESMLFVKDLFDMYWKHLTYLGYTYNIVELDKVAGNAIRHVSLMISGEDSFKKLRHEAGVHRVQRVPATEKSGRIHTSVVSVTVLPQPTEIEVKINYEDLKIDTMRASGAGGQHVNTTDSAVRITHVPTGIVAESQTEKSQIKNRSLALIKLKTRIYNAQFEKEQKSFNTLRMLQRGKGLRNEKIRTYNFIQDRITDHRLSDGTLHNLKNFLTGGEALDDLHTKLQEQLQHTLLSELLKSL